MRLLDLPLDVLSYFVQTSPRWTAWRLSYVNKGLRNLALPVVFRIQSIDVRKAEFFVENPTIAGLVRVASILPSAFFGTDDDPPSDQLMFTLVHVFACLSNLRELTLPLPDHTLTFQLLSVPPKLTSIRFTHAQPTPGMLRTLSRTCPNLTKLEYTLYPEDHPFWIMTAAALNDYADALALFPRLESIDLCASVHQIRSNPTIGRRIVFPGKFFEPSDILTSDSHRSPRNIALLQKLATLVLANKCVMLKTVMWSAPGRKLNTSDLNVWVWRIWRDNFGGVYAVSEGLRDRISTWDEAYHRMWSFKD